MIYHVRKSDKRLENEEQNTARYEKNPRNKCFVYLKLLLNCSEFQKTLKMNKLRNFLANPTVYRMRHSSK
jgi:hypothetical protein